MRPDPSRPLTGLVCRWAGSLPLSGSRPIISRESSEWACLIVSISRLNRVPSLSSRKSVHVQRPRQYGSPRLLPPAPPTASLTTRNLEQPAPFPDVSLEINFLFGVGVVGWEELPDETAAWTKLRSALAGASLPGV